jgi:Secretion system C-terminal sorting domain
MFRKIYTFAFFLTIHSLFAQENITSPTYYKETFNQGAGNWATKQVNKYKWTLTNKGPKSVFPDKSTIPLGVIDPALKDTSERWMIFDAFDGTLAVNKAFDARLISPRYDCSDFQEVYLRFNSLFRRSIADEKLSVGVSTDSINFEMIDLFKNIGEGQFCDGKYTFMKTQYPFSTTLHLDKKFAKSPKIWIAFSYKSPANPDGNYSWQLDDIELSAKDPTPTCDVLIKDDFFALAPYRKIPASQLDSIPFLLDFFNNSNQSKKNVTLSVTVENMQTKKLVFEDKINVAEIINGQTLENQYFKKKFLPPVNELTTYKITYKATPNCADENEKNNSYFSYFDVTADVFQKETGKATRKISPDFGGALNTSWAYGNHFYVKNGTGMKAKEISFAIDNSQELAGDSLMVQLLKWEDFDNDAEAQLNEVQLVGEGKIKWDGSKKINISLPLWGKKKEEVALEDETNYLALVNYKNMSKDGQTTMEMLVCDTLFYNAAYVASVKSGRPNYNSIIRVGNEPSYNTQGFEIPMIPIVRLSIAKLGSPTQEVDYEQNILVFPNPTKDVLWIKNNFSKEKIELLNALGQRIVLENSGTNELNVSSLPSGFYYLKIGKTIKKIIKE